MVARKPKRQSWLMNSGRTEKDNEYDKRTVFGSTSAACASGSSGARDDFDLLWSWLAARFRGRAREQAAGGASGFPTLHQPPRSEAHERAIDRKSTRLNSSHLGIS